MKLKFLKAQFKFDFEIVDDFMKEIEKLFKNEQTVAIYSSIQFLKYIPKISKLIEERGVKVITSKPDRAFYNSQILGCDSYKKNLKLEKEVDGFIYIGDGDFHPLALLFAQENEETTKPVLIYNPIQKEIKVYTRDLIKKNLQKRRGNLLKFHTSSIIGVFVSSKWGQERYTAALKLKERYLNKEFYFFISDNFLENEMENFPFVDVWVNTACPRIGQDDVVRQKKAVVNLNDVLD